TAADDVGEAEVEFKRHCTFILSSRGSDTSYAGDWSRDVCSSDLHTLTAVARDAAGNTTTSAGVSVTVNNTGPALPDVIVTSLSRSEERRVGKECSFGPASTPGDKAIATS